MEFNHRAAFDAKNPILIYQTEAISLEERRVVGVASINGGG